MNKKNATFSSHRKQSGFSLLEVGLALAVVAALSAATLNNLKMERLASTAQNSVEQLNVLPKAMGAAQPQELENRINRSALFPSLTWRLTDEKNGAWRADLRVKNEPKLCILLGAQVHQEKDKALVTDWDLVAVNGAQSGARETLEECARSEEVVFSFLIKGQGVAAVSAPANSSQLPSVDLESFSSDAMPQLKSWNDAGGF